MRKVYAIPGGVHAPDNKQQSLQQDIGQLPLAEKLYVPFSQHIGSPAVAVVNPGDRVSKGQMIAEADGYVSAAVHAPTSGVIRAICQHPVPHPSGMADWCIEIDVDGEDRWAEHQGTGDFRSLSRQDLLERIRRAGISGMGGAGFPASVKLNPGADKPIRTLIINAAECEPYITADEALMRERPEGIVTGIQILSYLLDDPEQVLIGIEDNKPEAYETLRPHLQGSSIELVEFPAKYPSGGEKQLIQILTGEELPSGKLPADIGMVCQNVGTVYAIYRAICLGEPLISRITTVTGNACRVQRNYEVPLGTPIQHLLDQCGFNPDDCSRLIVGGPMMGFSLRDTRIPVVKTTNCILAASPGEMPLPAPAQPCIRCGLCAQACPASLLPQQLFWYANSHNHEKLDNYNLFDCIECGACAYVCPSNIPLVQYYRAAKGEIRQSRAELTRSDRARTRFEQRKQRLEQAAVAKEAQRKARQQKARTRATDKSGDAGQDLIAQAMARVVANKASPEGQFARLERNIATAESRVQSASEKLAAADGTDTARCEAMQARLDEAQLKLALARKKLTAATQGGETTAASSTETDQKPTPGQ